MPNLQVEDGGNELRINVVVPMPDRMARTIGKIGAAAEPVKRKAPLVESLLVNERLGITHTPTFSIVRWSGETFAFTVKQAAVVEALVDAITEDGVEFLDERTLLACAESDGARIYPLFKGHPAWGRWIVSATALSHRPCCYRLSETF